MNIFEKLRHLPMQKRPSGRTIAPPPESAQETDREVAVQAASEAVSRMRFERLPRPAVIIYLFTGFSLILYLIGLLSPAFSDFFNRHISSLFRWLMAHLTNPIPFSVAEMLIFLLPLMFVCLVVYAVRHRCDTWRMVFVYIAEILCIVAVLFDMFIWSFGLAYHGTPLAEKLELERKDVSAEELGDTLTILIENLNETADEVNFRHNNFSVMPYSFAEMNEKLLETYDKVSDQLDFLPRLSSRLKPVMASEGMSYIHITGIYSYFTGEANLNMVFPDYTIPYTAAHELAHQRGIAPEDEANFMAFLICLASDDPYIRYSGYLNMYEYVASALHRADPEAYSELVATLRTSIYQEEVAYSAFYEKYRDSKASVVSGAVNDAYLKLQGTAGTQSYGMVVDLAVAYYKRFPPT